MSSQADLAPHELRILVAVDREGGFTAAATSLGLTQSAVSHAIRACEQKVGVVLFERGRHGARPTPAGERAVVHARRILRLLETLGAEARGATTGSVDGPLRIAAFRSAAAHLLPVALDRLTARHPGVRPEVSIVREIGRGTAGEVSDGRADIGIATVGPGDPVPAGLLSGKLFEESYALAYPRGHRDPRGLPLIDWDENCGSYTRQWWSEQDWLPRATITAQDDSVVLSMVAQRLGMAVAPQLSLLGAPPGVAVQDLGPGAPSRGVGYVTTVAMARSLAVRTLIRELRSTARAHVLREMPA
ncbi:LysR family transcriptional regulator [Catellatospora tritici]|uniref:LysR family transcriptional regulator n=1 Tax=Catellatospora tritici TaxID=2851566 RepID=UPI001C2CF4B7|nr:LysR family transcriptional regulator [Catellatospora tritici]MBV1856357.1 LysR family transcriptional regulator [Catellatospora tritici]